MEVWIRNPVKNWHNASIIWKAIILAFPSIGYCLAWKARSGRGVRIGYDPWLGVMRILDCLIG
jgi:hypothetical protein